ncbi:MAG: DUF1064 domain-containing protein [Sulfuricaulis sp.]|nr:DUF1064 domain-containing protein [Sulfuricaulis sp.]
MRLTEAEYEALMARRSADRAPVATSVPAAPESAPTGPKFKSKAEARYAQILESQQRAGQIRSWRYEAMTLVLAEGVRYTPDFLVVENTSRMTLIEVKGFMREAARVRLRVAVEMYPAFGWFLIWAKQGGFEPERLA